MHIEYILAGISILLIVSILASKISYRLGVPALLLFLFIGMLAGSEGIGGIVFKSFWFAQFIGIGALIFILFSGGLETDWEKVKPTLSKGIALSTIGVLITAGLVGWFAIYILGFSLLQGLLLGAIVSSTDAAAVFSVLRSKKVSLAGQLKPLLELESGSNDPMAVFLTLGFIGLIINPQATVVNMALMFILQMSIGAIVGFGMGKAIVFVLNKLKLEYDGLYPVLTIGLIVFTYSIATVLQGNGFLAVYITGLILGNTNFVNKKSLVHFHGGLAWLMQITMFLSLGLLVVPSHIVPVVGVGLLVSMFLMFIARPVSVFFTLFPAKISFKQKVLISWVGLRGSVPIILATFPLIAGIKGSEIIFNMVFFIVLTSALLQGSTIPFVAKLLKVDAPFKKKQKYPIEFDDMQGTGTRLEDFTVGFSSKVVGKSVLEIGLPDDSLITLIARNDDFVVPGGKTIIEEGDVLLVLVNDDNLALVQQILFAQKK
ncbi:potassium/proton antiporter [Elusimicrobiota bacterium]